MAQASADADPTDDQSLTTGRMNKVRLWSPGLGLKWLKHVIIWVAFSHVRRPISVHMSKVGQILSDKIVIRVFTAFYSLLSLSERTTLDTIFLRCSRYQHFKSVRSIRRPSGLRTSVYVAVQCILSRKVDFKLFPKIGKPKFQTKFGFCLDCLRYCLHSKINKKFKTRV